MYSQLLLVYQSVLESMFGAIIVDTSENNIGSSPREGRWYYDFSERSAISSGLLRAVSDTIEKYRF